MSFLYSRAFLEILIGLILISSFVNQAFAYTEGFESLNKTLERPPYVCVVEPSLAGQEQNVMREIKAAVDEWRSLLQNQERNKEAMAKWDIGYEVVPLKKQEGFDYSKCNIIIVFEPRPPEEPKQIGEDQWYYVLGKNQFFSDEHGTYALATIYYQDVKDCEASRDEYYIYYKPCYYDGIILAVKQANIAKYLIGQAFGLGQYVSDDPRVHEAWAKQGALGPSIMMPYIHQSDTPQMITQKDIAVVRQIYGDEGFSGLLLDDKTDAKTEQENIDLKSYFNKQYGFSLKIPKDWQYTEFTTKSDVELLMSFYDDPEYPTITGDVVFLKGYGYGQYRSDAQLENELFLGLSQSCQMATFEVEGYTCSSPKLIDSNTKMLSDKKAYIITYSWVTTYPSGSIETISKVVSFSVGIDNFLIYIDSNKDSFEQHQQEINSIIDSIDVSNMKIESTSSDIQILDNVFTYTEATKNLPLILINPTEFTPHWYVDVYQNFALKFNKPWKDHWSLQKSNSGNEIKFSSFDSTGFLTVKKYDDQNLINEIRRVEVSELDAILIPHAISFAKDIGAQRIDLINAQVKSDGYVIWTSLSKFEGTADKIRTYDRIQIINDNGKIFEITYSDIDYKSIPIFDLDLMIRSFYEGDVSKISLVEKSKPLPYSNSGVSYTPPQGWSRQDFNADITTTSGLEIPFTTMYYRDNYEGLFPSYIVVVQKRFDSVDVDVEKDDELSYVISGLRDSLESNGFELLEITQSEIEIRQDHEVVQLEAKIRIPLNAVDYIDANVKEYAMTHEKGTMAALVLYSDAVDFPIVKSEFTQSVVSLQIKEELDQTSESASINNEQKSGCLIATASYGTELAPQVQLLREIRDKTLLQTSSGSSFMIGFNAIYYSFSPTISDWERQNVLFREIVKITITPMLSTLSILNYVNIDSEREMLGYGAGIILLNVGMYFVIPAVLFLALKRKLAVG
ncbi:MAG: CFI-box-CTERM domain-containing protein [Candidatus Nitrosotenuis sp.]